MKKLIFTVILFLGFLNISYAGVYCTANNWSKAKSNFVNTSKTLSFRNKQYDELISEHDNRSFLFDTYTFEDLSALWGLENKTLEAEIDAKRSMSKTSIRSFKFQLKVYKRLRDRFERTRDIWEELADNCYDEANYDSYRAGINNVKITQEKIDEVEEMMVNLHKKNEDYVREVRFIDASKENYKENCGCSQQ